MPVTEARPAGAVDRPEPPDGTLTLLFSDIEGSTRLLDRLGLAYRELLSTQRQIMRRAIADHHGLEMGTEGDSFFVVFRTAAAAVGAAVQAQEELAATAWPEDAEVRVRMGLHTGEPLRHEEGYVGMDVHLAARVASTARGGQVLLSDTTRLLLGRAVDRPVRDLGLHRLKDVPGTQRLFEVVLRTPAAPEAAARPGGAGAAALRSAGAGGPGSPPVAPGAAPGGTGGVRSLGSPADLPPVHGTLVGRERELELVGRLLGRGQAVTIVGPGGVGKSRLAIAAAHARADLPDGVHFVSFADVTDVGQVWAAGADAAGLAGGPAAREQVLAGLADRRLLLVLDNLEHLPGVARAVRDVLAAAPGVEVLVTSRSPLHLLGEQLVPLAPLQPSDAVELFVEQARRLRPAWSPDAEDLRTIRTICERLDGLPLAVELVASRSRLLTPRALLSRLDHTLDLSAHAVDRADRQQTLRSTLDWSWRLLSPASAVALSRLSVFRGPFGIGDAATVLDADEDVVVDHLLDLSEASLVHADDEASGEPRFRLLRVVGSYARERLREDPDAEADARTRQAEVAARLVRYQCARLRGTHHVAALDALEEQHDNIVQALDWSLRPGSPRLATGLELCRLLSWHWHTSSHQAEGRRWLTRAGEVAGDGDDAETMATWHGLGILLDQHGELDRAAALLQRCLDAAVARGDRPAQGRESNSLASVERRRGNPARARELYLNAHRLAVEDADDERVSTSLTNLALLDLAEGDAPAALDLLTRVLAIDQRLGDVWGIAVDRLNLAQAHLAAGDLTAARDGLLGHGREMLALGDSEMDAELLEHLALLAVRLERPGPVAVLVGAADAVRSASGIARSPEEGARLAEGVAPAAASVGAEAWASGLREGHALTAADAWAHARAALQDPAPDTPRGHPGG